MISETDQGEIMSDVVTSTPELKKNPSIEHTRTEAPDNSLGSPVTSLEASDLSHATLEQSHSTPGLFALSCLVFRYRLFTKVTEFFLPAYFISSLGF